MLNNKPAVLDMIWFPSVLSSLFECRVENWLSRMLHLYSAAIVLSLGIFTSISTHAQTVPSAPIGLTVKSANGLLRLSFNSPASDGGTPILNYTASCTGNTSTTTTNGASSPITISGLTNGQSYTCTVRATNSIGTSPPSTPVTKIVRPINLLPILPLIHSRSPITVTATITGQPQGVTSTAEGSINPASQSVTPGSTTFFSVVAANGYIATVSGCGGSLSGTTYTTGSIYTACTVTASFTINQSPATDPGYKSSMLWIPPDFVASPLNNSNLVVADLSGSGTWPPVSYIPGCLNGLDANNYYSGCAASGYLYTGRPAGLSSDYTVMMGPTKTLSLRLKANATLSTAIKSIKISGADGSSNLPGSVSLWLTTDPTISYEAADSRCKDTKSSNLYIYTSKNGGNYCPLTANGLYYLNVRANFTCTTNCRFKVDGGQDDFQ